MAYDDQPYWDRPAMMESPSSGGFQDDWAPQDSPGLGLSTPEMAPIGQDASNDYRQFVGSLPLLDRMAMLRDSGGVTSLASQFMGQRQNLALKLQQQKEREQQFNWQEMLRIDKEYSNDPDKWQVGMQHLYQQRGFTPAGHMLQAGGKKMAGELASSLPFLQRYYPDFVKRYDQDPKSVSVAEVKSVLDGVQKLKAQRATADANAQELAALEKGYQAYLGGDKSAMMPGDAERLIELRNQAEKQNLEMEKLRLGNKKLAADIEKTPEDKGLGHDREAFTQQFFKDKYGPTVTYKQLSSDEQTQVNNKIAQFQGQISGNRTANIQNEMGNVSVGQLRQAQEWRDPVSGKAAPSWARPNDLKELGFVNIEPSQAPTITQLGNVDAALDTIEKAGNSILRKSGGRGWTEIPKGMLQVPIIKLFEKFAGDPELGKLQSAIKISTPAMAKLGGDTANVAVAEREIYQSSVFDPSDTLESFAAKLKVLKDANKRTKQALGFVHGEEGYIQQLVARGYSDERIKAMVKERRRYQ